jgi:RNA polymerase sigma-70 factor, ECF subfamily
VTTSNPDQFSELILANQRKLFAFILTLVPNLDTASDILQQTNVVLWRDAERFNEGTNFLSWAFRVAYFQVLDDREKRQRDRLQFNNELIDDLAREAEQESDHYSSRLEAMRLCLKQLPVTQQKLISGRYGEGLTVAAIAKSRGQAAGAVATYLHRIRRALLDCIQRRLGSEAR